jgi:hypothetical protein
MFVVTLRLAGPLIVAPKVNAPAVAETTYICPIFEFDEVIDIIGILDDRLQI